MAWADEEMSGLSLGDARLNQRVCKLLTRLSSHPEASIPGACGGAAEVKAAYRLIERKGLDWRRLLEPHWERSRERMASEPVVLCIQDTTELDFNGRQTAGLGRLSYEAQRGLYLHPTYAVTPSRVPLGVLDCWMWARGPKDEPALAESRRWVEGYERVGELAARLPSTRLVYLADREADMAELFARAETLGFPADLLVRIRHDRSLGKDGRRLFDELAQAPVLGEVGFELAPGRGRKARRVVQAVSVLTIRIHTTAGKTVALTAVQAIEQQPPAGEKPVCWRLFTNRSVDSLEAAVELIDWYRARWEIEMFFNIFKTGCRVEALQLATVERVERALALYLVVAWRINYLMRLGRECPELSCEAVFEPDEWRAAYVLAKRKPPATPPDLNTVMRLVASAGGFLGRKGDGHPGAKVLWLGMQAVFFCAEGIGAGRELAAQERCG